MNCEHCGKEILKTQQGKRFCSTTCWYASRKLARTVNCVVCGVVFEKAYKAQKACSQACAHKAKNIDRNVTCACCGKVFQRPHGKQRTCCSISCSMKIRKMRPDGFALPDGTVREASNGYLRQKVGGAWVMQHRHVMELKLGRQLSPQERVHHKDGDRKNNDPENLELWLIRKSSKKDPPGQRWKDVIETIPFTDGMSAAEARAILLEHLLTPPS